MERTGGVTIVSYIRRPYRGMERFPRTIGHGESVLDIPRGAMTTTELLSQRIELVFHWYQGMVNPRTGFFEYLYLPATDTFVREESPIRDIASLWDAALVAAFVESDELRSVIERSLARYSTYLVQHDRAVILGPHLLREPSSIAHSAFMILALLHAPSPVKEQEIRRLADGLVHQQRRDGSYKVYFDDLPDSGEELYAGEAMLALLETHRALGDQRLLDSAARGYAYYDQQFFREGRVGDDLLVFFANWQSQACRLLFEDAGDRALRTRVADFLLQMHDRIIGLGFFDAVERRPERQVAVEVACALEGLNDAYAVAVASGDDARAASYRRSICIGLTYLVDLQCVRSEARREIGGFGMSRDDRTQRIDVTGHAASAFLKSIANGITRAGDVRQLA